MACPVCTSTDLVGVDLEVGQEKVRFSSCRLCEHRWWAGSSGPVPLNSVLARVASRPTPGLRIPTG